VDGHIENCHDEHIIISNKHRQKKDVQTNKKCLTHMVASKAGFSTQGAYFTLSVVHMLQDKK
jgi:hypothetical protein